MKNKKGFTLIELLAVIIILGVLMIIAIPAVTKYIEDSRKNSYISTAKEIVNGARNLIHSADFDLNDTDTTYYIDGKCISTDNGYKSPYGDITKSYVIVTSTNEGHNYFFTGVDSTGTGIKKIININNLDIDNIERDINELNITTNMGIDEREKIVIIDENCERSEEIPVETRIRSDKGEKIVVCKSATTLHTKTCERTSEGCGVKIGNGNTITYGTIKDGNIKSGDAFDCDVNDDGVYDSTNERFYYVRSDGDKSILIYYQNMNGKTTYPYDLSGANYLGPRDGYKYLPSKDDWKNPFLIEPGTRQIVTHNNRTYTQLGTTELFTYTGKVARFPTSQDINIACGITMGGYSAGELDRCIYLMEDFDNFEIETSGLSGYWLENPTSSGSIWHPHGTRRNVGSDVPKTKTSYGVRPVITIKTFYIE